MTKHTHYPMLGDRAKKGRRLPCEIDVRQPKPYQKIINDPEMRRSQMTVLGKPVALSDEWDKWNWSKFDVHSEQDSREEVKYMAEEKKKAPEHIRAGVLSLSIWTNKGEMGTYKTFSLQRGYQDKDKNWQNTESLRGQDLLPLAELLRKAYDMYVATKEKTE